MKFRSGIAAVVVAAGLLTPSAVLLAQGPPPPPPQGYGQGPGYGPGQGPGYGQGPGGWDAPPASYRRDLERNAFRMGLDGASKDLQNRRRPNVLNRDEYRNYRGPDRRAYRRAFEAGYNAFWSHNNGFGGPRPY